MSPDVLVITVNFHTEPQVVDLARSLAAQTLPCRLLVADNGSDAAGRRTLDDLAHDYPWARVVPSGANVGYFGAAAAVVAAIEPGRLPDWLVVANPDLTLAPDFVGKLVEVDADVVAPNVVDERGRALNPFMESRPGNWFLWSRRLIFSTPGVAAAWVLASTLRHRPRSRPGGTRAIYAGHGAVLAFRDTYFRRGGALHHEPFLFGEELTVAENVRRIGGQIVFAPDVCAVHVGHVATGRFPSRSMLAHQREATRYAHQLLRGGC